MLCLTIIGIPLGLANFKLITVGLRPFGREIVSVEEPAAAECLRQSFQRRLADNTISIPGTTDSRPGTRTSSAAARVRGGSTGPPAAQLYAGCE